MRNICNYGLGTDNQPELGEQQLLKAESRQIASSLQNPTDYLEFSNVCFPGWAAA